jgi:hypothetical protein
MSRSSAFQTLLLLGGWPSIHRLPRRVIPVKAISRQQTHTHLGRCFRVQDKNEAAGAAVAAMVATE